MSNRDTRPRSLAVALLLGLWLFPLLATAHDIPNQIRLQGFIKPVDETLHFVVRVPLVMLLNLNLPKHGPGFLALDHMDETLGRAATATARQIVLYQDGRRLVHDSVTTRISLLSERTFGSFEEALAHVDGPPLPTETQVFWNQGYFDAHLQYAIHASNTDFALELLVAPGLRNILTMFVQFLPRDGAQRVYELHYGSGPVRLDPSWHHAAWTFTKLGFAHILEGIDHLLFLLCLVAPFQVRQLWSLTAVITSFTIAHSVTLVASVLGYVPNGTWFPPFVELMIAVSIFYMAVANVVSADLRRRWIITGFFGLVHGFGFSFVLQDSLQLAGPHLFLSLLSFNVGVELGQLVFLLAVLPVLGWLFRDPGLRRVGLILVSVLVGHTAWHWIMKRFEALDQSLGLDLGEVTSPTMLGVIVILGAVVTLALVGPARRFVNDRRIASERVARRTHGSIDIPGEKPDV